MTLTPEPPVLHRRFYKRLGFRFAFLLAAVLLPLTLISMTSSLRAVKDMRARSETALTGATMLAASNEARLIQEARGSAEALASLIGPMIGNDAACSAALRGFAAAHPIYAQVSFIPVDGQLRCSSTGKKLDVSAMPIFLATVKEARPSFALIQLGPISGISVLAISDPVLGATGVYLGYISISLPHSIFDGANRTAGGIQPVDLITFDRTGEILVATVGLEHAATSLPDNHPLSSLLPDHPLAFSAETESGQTRVFSVVPIVPGEIFALGSWPAEAKASLFNTLTSIPFLLPALIWIASLLVAVLSVEWLVNRHIRRLSYSITSFAGGNRMLTEVDVRGAPLEIREMAAAFEQMTDAVIRDEAELEDILHQKEVLLREVHHRVKNNLQMIVSIMNMHVRKARTPETRGVIKVLQGRVMSLATIHHELYQTKGESDVHVAELLDAIARQTVNVASGKERRVDLRLHLDDIRMTPDQAVPLALLVGEGLMNAVSCAPQTSSGAAPLDLRLTWNAPDSAVVEIEGMAEGHDANAPVVVEDGVGLSEQLMTVFAMQMGGSLEHAVAPGKYKVRVAFKLRPLAEGEDRHAAGVEATA